MFVKNGWEPIRKSGYLCILVVNLFKKKFTLKKYYVEFVAFNNSFSEKSIFI